MRNSAAIWDSISFRLVSSSGIWSVMAKTVHIAVIMTPMSREYAATIVLEFIRLQGAGLLFSLFSSLQ
ncbi:MAG: hypothetical protein A3K60_00100 [Euryarchaeota archaeon RBG_19FT_COMBO_56_21]|nr:MAG: hypothetical protein A3K60_00100 [Euryarchaeota archaeon RBG_19FT_COMBO_56_21]